MMMPCPCRRATLLALMAALSVRLTAGGSCDGTAGCERGADTDEGASLLQIRPLSREIAVQRLRTLLGIRPRGWTTPVGDGTDLAEYEACHLATSTCSLQSMAGRPTLVYPGGDTSCFDGPYAFSVYPGDTDKLAIVFEGGGACWVANGSFGRVAADDGCTWNLTKAVNMSGAPYGMYNRTDAENPFRTWTIVEAIYCSGDAFVGTATVDYEGVLRPQRGYVNALAVKRWAVENFGSRSLENFAVTGWSAGSLGAMAWSANLLGTFRYRHASVLFDSYAGAFPEGIQDYTLKAWGACNSSVDLWPRKFCADGNLNVQRIVAWAMASFPQISFVSVQSKADWVQIFFYDALALSWGEFPGITSPACFYKQTLDIFRDWRRKAPNYAAYLIDGKDHTFEETAHLSTASTVGPDAAPPRGRPSLERWAAAVVDSSNGVRSQCFGPTAAPTPWSTAYCPGPGTI